MRQCSTFEADADHHTIARFLEAMANLVTEMILASTFFAEATRYLRKVPKLRPADRAPFSRSHSGALARIDGSSDSGVHLPTSTKAAQ